MVAMVSRRDRYLTRRYGGQATTVSVPAQAQTIVTSEPDLVYADELSYQEARGLGDVFNRKQKALGQLSEKISAQERRIFERQKKKKDVTSNEARLAELRAVYSRELGEYQASQARYSEDALRYARESAPKQFFSGAQQGRGFAENKAIRAEVSQKYQARKRNDAEKRAKAQTTPGIYRLSSGEVLVSQAQEGTFVGPRGNVVTVRAPVAQTRTGKYVYRSTQPSQERTVTGFNLNDPQTRQALRQSAGDYRTAGLLYGAAQASYAPTPSAPARKTTKVRYKGILGTPYSSADLVQIAGSKLAQSNIPLVRGLGKKFATDPTYTGELIATYYGGRTVGQAGKVALAKVASRYGVGTARNVELGMSTLGVGTIAYEASTSTGEEFGANLPRLIAGGAGFYRGYKSIYPTRTEFVEPSQVRFSSRGAGGDIFKARGTARGLLIAEKYGVRQVRFPTVRYGIQSLRPSTLQSYRGDVPVVARASSRYELFGRRYSVNQRYGGILRRGEQYETLVLTSGRGRGRVTYEALLSRDALSARGRGESNLFNLYRASVYRGTQTPRLLRVSEGAASTGVVDYRQAAINYALKGRVGPGEYLIQSELSGVRSLPFEYTRSRGLSRVRTPSDGGTTYGYPSRDVRGFEILGQNRLYRSRLEGPRGRASALREYFDQALFPRRAGRLYSGLVLESPRAGSSTLRPPRGVLRSPTSGGRPFVAPFAGLPIAVPGLRSSFFPLTGSALGGRYNQRLAQETQTAGLPPGFDQRRLNAQFGAFRTSQYSLFGTDSSFVTGRRSVPRTTSTRIPRTTTTTVPGFGFSITPGIPPGIPGISFPGVGGDVGGGLAGGGRARRGYGYAPSLQAIALGIRARRGRRRLSRQTFTGLEALRPLL